ncbi:MAG: choice-of-anchor D domain-containing protein [Nitrospirae bacterium]|nr:choice-of-anchor D domain-containing protein [Nitrospirota bacterium]
MIPAPSYKTFFIGLIFLVVIHSAAIDLSASTVTISWEPPVTNSDGSPLTDLAGYNIYYGTATGNYNNSIDVGNVTTYQITGLTSGLTYYFAAKAYDTSGNESLYSNEVATLISALPAEISVADSSAPSGDLQIPFGNVKEGDSLNHTVTLGNTGNANLEIGNVAAANTLTAPFSLANDNCSGQSIVPSGSCTFTVRFSPASAGTFTDTFNIPSNDSDENPVTVSVSGTGLLNNTPNANAGGPYAATEGQAITLDGSASSDSDGSIVLYEWDINSDGTYDYTSSTSARTHTYTQQGTYTVTLRVKDDFGKTKTASATAIIADTSPSADFTASPSSGTTPLDVTFNNGSAGYDQPLTYVWDFDNNGTADSTVINPSYTFTGLGTYTVKLTVMDSDGSTRTLTRTNYITVTPSAYQLTVNVTNSGTVTSSLLGISCPGDCTEQYSSGTVITLTAVPQPGEVFGGWTGCSNSTGNQCTLTMNTNTSVAAAFTASAQSLSCTDGGSIRCLERTDGGSDRDNLVSNKPKSDLEYRFRIVLKDPSGQAPQNINLYMTQRSDPQAWELYSYDMSCSGDYSVGALCTYVTKLGPAAVHTFYFEAMMADGTILRYPDSGYISGPEIRLLPGYNLVGIPRDSGNGSLTSATAFGGAAAYKWDADSGRYVKLSASEPVLEGTGYYVSKQTNTLLELKEFGEITDIQFTYKLKAGWNIISNPYSGNVALADILVRKGNNAPVTWTEATANGWLTNAIYYNSSKDWGDNYIIETAPAAKIIPWLGYWIYVDKADDTYYLVIQKSGM